MGRILLEVCCGSADDVIQASRHNSAKIRVRSTSSPPSSWRKPNTSPSAPWDSRSFAPGRGGPGGAELRPVPRGPHPHPGLPAGGQAGDRDPPDLFLRFTDHALAVREAAPWCGALDWEIFAHYVLFPPPGRTPRRPVRLCASYGALLLFLDSTPQPNTSPSAPWDSRSFASSSAAANSIGV